jgi:hypothetical protein
METIPSLNQGRGKRKQGQNMDWNEPRATRPSIKNTNSKNTQIKKSQRCENAQNRGKKQ